MKKQIFLLSALPIFVLAVFAAFVESFTEIEQARKEWASFTSGQLLLLADGVRQAGSDAQREVALRAIALAGYPGEVRDAAKVNDDRVNQSQDIRGHVTNALMILATKSQGSAAEWPSSDIALALDKSSVLVFRVFAPRGLPAYGANLIADMFWVGLLTAPVLCLSLYLSFLITRPLARFTLMARRISLDDEISSPFVAGGTSELQSLAETLNTMRARIKKVIDQRANMLRAMGHDLRTPPTRLRMRAECCTDLELQGQMLLDIDTLAGMIDESMTYLKDMTADVGLSYRTDLTSLLQTIVSGFADMGVSISFAGPPRLPMTCKPTLLTRAVTNLIDNASRYAENIEVVLIQGPNNDVTIEIDDDGPGVTDDMKVKVMEPFFKGDEARPVREHVGIGLGLAIASGVAKHHGGQLSLHDRKPRGLSARLTIRSLDEPRPSNIAPPLETRKSK
jgi:signal transduction histidine kinase